MIRFIIYLVLRELRLVKPQTKLEDSFRKMSDDFARGGEDPYQVCRTDGFNFDMYVESLQNEANGVGLKPGYVSGDTYWLLNPDGEMVGGSRLRHGLNDFLEHIGGHIGYEIAPSWREKGLGTELLRLTLEKARARGLNRVLLTTDSDNWASIKVIEKNGGVLEDERIDSSTGLKFRRYWIAI